MLIPEQKVNRVDTASTNLELFQLDPEKFLARLVTQDETWVPHFPSDTKMDSVQWKHTDPHPYENSR